MDWITFPISYPDLLLTKPSSSTRDLGKRLKRDVPGFFCIHHFYIDHNAPCLPSKILHNHRFQYLLSITVVPREIEENGYEIYNFFFWRRVGRDKQGTLWSKWKWWWRVYIAGILNTLMHQKCNLRSGDFFFGGGKIRRISFSPAPSTKSPDSRLPKMKRID